MNEFNQLFDTQDMGLAVALLSKGFEIGELEEPRYGSRVTFRFMDVTGLNEAAQEYWAGRLLVDAKSYWNESKNLKTRLYSLK